jgi:hypothetical protein
MVALKSLLLMGGVGMMALALAVLTYDLSLLFICRRALASGASLDAVTSRPLRWRMILALLILGWTPLLIALGVMIAPDPQAASGVSQPFVMLGLFPGAHFVVPLAEGVGVIHPRERVSSARPRERAENPPSSLVALPPTASRRV